MAVPYEDAVVRWNSLTSFTGRNGCFQCSGVEILHHKILAPHELSFTPITSKGDLARCDITVPRESIPAIIEKLQAIYSSK